MRTIFDDIHEHLSDFHEKLRIMESDNSSEDD